MKFAVRTLAALLVIAFIAGAAFYWNPLWFSDQLIRYHLWRSDVRSEYTQVDGYRIHYFEAVPPHGAPGIPLLLIHGLGSRGEDWSPMIPTLAAKGFHVYAPDLLGYGRSTRPDVPYSVSLEESVVVGFMQAVNQPHADLDGWSMGGWIAARIALDHPDLVDRLVLDDSAGLTFQPTFDRTTFVPTTPAALDRLFALLTPHPPTLPAFAVRATLRKVASEGKIIQQTMDSMEAGGDLIDARIATIRQPTLIVWGMADVLIPPAVGETMHRDIPNSVFAGIAGCGHLAPGECPKPVLAATLQFLKSTPPPRGGEQILPETALANPNSAH
jgi:pimeloyl-ACP methyl ester carboxylesterase